MDFRVKGICPFGCTEANEDKESDFDDHGYCRHYEGALNLASHASPIGRLFEPIEPIYYPVRDSEGKPMYEFAERLIEVEVEETLKDDKTGEEIKVKTKRQVPRRVRVPLQIHSGLMRLNGRKRRPITKDHVILRPEKVQEMLTTVDPLTKVVTAPRLGFHTRVYRKDADTPVVTKPNDDDPAARVRMLIEDHEAELLELRERQKKLAKSNPAMLGYEDGEDEEAVATEAAKPENVKAETDKLRGRVPASV